MARPVRTSNLLKEAAADHENLDRTAEQERLPVNRVATQPPVQENESVIEKAEEKEPSVQKNWMRSFRRTFLVNLRICLIVRMSIRKSR